MPNRHTRADVPHRDEAVRLAKLMRDTRADRRLSQQGLATAAGVSIGTVRGLETERSVDPSFFTVLALAAALQLPLSAVEAATRRSPISPADHSARNHLTDDQEPPP